MASDPKKVDPIEAAKASLAEAEAKVRAKQLAEKEAARGAGVYPVSSGGYSASISKPDGTLGKLGTFKTHDEARKAYIEAQRKLYPPPPPTPVDPAKHHTLSAQNLTVKH